jgi:hypothetical protein
MLCAYGVQFMFYYYFSSDGDITLAHMLHAFTELGKANSQFQE